MCDLIDFGSFVNRSKKTSNSILFDEKEVYDIYKLSCIVKLFAVFSSSDLVEKGQDKINKNSFDYLIRQAKMKAVTNKIHHVVYTKLFRCVGLDPMVMKTMQLKSVISNDDFVLYLFDYVISAILAIYDMIRNPITFIVTSADQVMQWHIRALYQKSIVYKDTGELFGKSMATTNLPEKIITDKIYEYIEEYVTSKNKTFNVIINEESYDNIDKYFYNFFVIPLYTKIFNLKSYEGDYNTFQKINIQLFLYYTLKEFMEGSNTNVFPKVGEDDFITSKEICEKYKLLEILKRIPIAKDDNYTVSKSGIFLNDDFLIDDSSNTGSKKNYLNFQYNSTYRVECSAELLSSEFKFYGVNNIMILNNYLKVIMNILINLDFKNLFIYDLTKESFKCRKFARQVELEILPYLMVILDNQFDFFDEYKEYVVNTYSVSRNQGNVKVISVSK